MAFADFEAPEPTAEVVNLFRYSKNRPGIPTESKTVRFDQHFVRQVEEIIQAGVDPRCKTFSDAMRDAGIAWLKCLVDRMSLEDTPLGNEIGRFIAQEDFFYEKEVETRDAEFLAQLRDSVETARVKLDGDKLDRLRIHGIKVAGRSNDSKYQEAIMGMFKNDVR